MKYLDTRSNKQGFTIVELMIATVIFSMVMLMCITGMVQVSRAYYKGLAHSRTQEAGRNIMDEISQNIQLSGSAVSVSPSTSPGPEIASNSVADGTGVFCAGNKKYTYAIDRKVAETSSEANKEIRNAIISEDIKCTDTMTASDLTLAVSGTTRSLLGENMRLTKFRVVPYLPHANVDLKSGSQLWQIEISIAYGDQDLIGYLDDQENARVTCNPGTGNEFCSTVDLSTIVSRRIGQ